MGWKRSLFEAGVWGVSRFAPAWAEPPSNPKRIFVLRNNDIGDLLVITPLFEALRRRYPNAEILAGIGDWNRPVLQNNPYVDRVIPIHAPWHNQQVRPQGVIAALKYIARSPEVTRLREEQCEIGIDVLGSPFGSLLMMKAGIPFRMGVRGYAGGDSAVQRAVDFHPHRHVGEQALALAKLLGAAEVPENRPQLFLEKSEPVRSNRIVVAPGGGFEAKRWPIQRFCDLAGQLSGLEVVVIGGKADRPLADAILQANPAATDLAGRTDLRETFQIIASAAVVVANSSMAMHVAAAFRRPCIVVLGTHFPSAKEHALQWGHPETVFLGREYDKDTLATVDEVRSRVQELCTKNKGCESAF